MLITCSVATCLNKSSHEKPVLFGQVYTRVDYSVVSGLWCGEGGDEYSASSLCAGSNVGW